TLYYPKWLATAAGVAIKNGHEVDLVDAPAGSFSVQAVIDRIASKNIEAVVCDTSTPSILNDVSVVEAMVAANPSLHVLMVGRHVSSLPKETLAMSPSLEAVAIREYEYTVRDWLAAKACGADLSTVEGLVWRSGTGEIISNKQREAIKNLDELPFVSEVYKRFLHTPDYFYGHSLWPLVVFDTSRGCPYHCSFCVYPQTFSGHTMRYRSVANVADEFEFVAREMPEIKTVMLEDDTFIVSRPRTLELANELIRRGNKLPFDANCRADIGAEDELLSTLHKAGARLFCVGFESGDVEVINGMKKNNDDRRDAKYHEEAHKFVRRCQKAGIMVHGCFMVGNLNETPASMEKTLGFAKALRPDTAQFFPIMVYPGTVAYQEAKKRDYIQIEDWGAWLTKDGLHNSVVTLPNITHEQLVSFCDRARRSFYLAPSYLAYKLKQSLMDRRELQRNVKGFVTLSKYLLRGSEHDKTATAAKTAAPAKPQGAAV
ncbi:MAG: anaerobic magnesium-protoporphyrin monomethyl ester cyclase, partial [Acidobacteriaceae bacterium]|nr:anaerobic magnesium-protoporphyrin monomethyl ester cyclase [Acidobacteriaceae bacterium]